VKHTLRLYWLVFRLATTTAAINSLPWTSWRTRRTSSVAVSRCPPFDVADSLVELVVGNDEVKPLKIVVEPMV
jgi:hypothetical protein